MKDGCMEDEQAKQSVVLSSMEGWVFDIENIAEKGLAAAAPRVWLINDFLYGFPNKNSGVPAVPYPFLHVPCRVQSN